MLTIDTYCFCFDVFIYGKTQDTRWPILKTQCHAKFIISLKARVSRTCMRMRRRRYVLFVVRTSSGQRVSSIGWKRLSWLDIDLWRRSSNQIEIWTDPKQRNIDFWDRSCGSILSKMALSIGVLSRVSTVLKWRGTQCLTMLPSLQLIHNS